MLSFIVHATFPGWGARSEFPIIVIYANIFTYPLELKFSSTTLCPYLAYIIAQLKDTLSDCFNKCWNADLYVLMLHCRMTGCRAWLIYGAQTTGSVWQSFLVSGQTFSASIAGRNSLAQTLWKDHGLGRQENFTSFYCLLYITYWFSLKWVCHFGFGAFSIKEVLDIAIS